MGKIKIILITILLIAAFFRLWNLGTYPPSLTQDEASLGYNAYSILKTGRDEFGKFLPVIFSSFGDYKPGLYVYFALPFVAIFGLNEFSTRLPSALAGILIVYLIYLIVRELRMQVVKRREIRLIVPEVAVAFIASINPWLIHFSRGAWEANLSLSLTLVGILFFLKSFKNNKYILLSVLFFSLTLITYQGAKLSTTIVVILLSLIYFQKLKAVAVKNFRLILLSLVLGFVIATPAIFSFARGQTGRLTVFSIFSYPRPEEYTAEFLEKANEKKDSLNYYLFHSESLNFLRGVLGRLFNHYSARFLFFEGDYQNPRHSSPYQGMMLIFDFFIFPFGIYAVINSKNKRFGFLIILWLILAPLPAALTRDQVHGVRALNMSIPLVIISGYGLYFLITRLYTLKATSGKTGSFCFLFLLFIISITYYLDSYYIHTYKHNARYWFYGYKDVVKKVSEIRGQYDTVIFQQSYNQPYIYFLFHERYEPKAFQENYNFKSGGIDVGIVEELENIDFQFFSWPPEIKSNRTLIVGDTVVIPDSYDKQRFNLIYEVKYPDNFTVAYRILETKPELTY